MTLKLRLLFLPPGKTRGQGPAAAPHRARCGSSLRPEGTGTRGHNAMPAASRPKLLMTVCQSKLVRYSIRCDCQRIPCSRVPRGSSAVGSSPT